MKVWFLADTHFGVRADDMIWLKDYYDFFNKVIIPYMRKNVQPDDILVHLGDVFDNRACIGLKTNYYVLNLFKKFNDIFSDIRICVGNHDMADKLNNEITSVEFLKLFSNVKVYQEPIVEQIGSKKVLFMPWFEDVDKQKEIIKNNKVDYVFGHLQIGGCVNNKGMQTVSGVSSTDFSKAQVYAGHIHIRQNFKNIHYVGNPYHKTREDMDNEKGITIIDIETGEGTFLKNKFSPVFIKTSIYDIMDLPVSEVREMWRNNYVDFVVNSDDKDKCDIDKLKDAVGNVYKSFTPITNKSKGETNNEENVTIDETKSSGDLLHDFIDVSDIKEEYKEIVKKQFDIIIEKSNTEI